MRKYRLVPDEGSDEKVIVLGNDKRGGLDSIIEDYVGEILKKTLGKKTSDEEFELKKRRKPRIFSLSDVTCWSFVLLATSPWTGLWVLKALESAKLEWAQVLLPK